MSYLTPVPRTVFIALLALASTTQAEVPNTFSPGDVATAEAFNENFQALDQNINDINQEIQTLTGYVSATVNGITMQVKAEYHGRYEIITPTGATIYVDEEGHTDNDLYFESEDCSGQPYAYRYEFDSKYIDDKQSGEQFANPRLSQRLRIGYDGSQIYYAEHDEIVKLYPRSYRTPKGCEGTSRRIPASKFQINDPSVTGINQLPLIITGVGTEVRVGEAVGSPGAPSRGSINVYANGEKIGTAYTGPDEASERSIYVKLLSQYGNQEVQLSKDGSYTGGRFSVNAELYFLTEDCTGTAYIEVLKEAESQWWDESLVDLTKPRKNNDNYYTLSNQTYRANTTEGSYLSYNSDTCTSSVTALSLTSGYKQAIPGSAPQIPVFSPPITIEDYSEPTSLDSLPGMD